MRACISYGSDARGRYLEYQQLSFLQLSSVTVTYSWHCAWSAILTLKRNVRVHLYLLISLFYIQQFYSYVCTRTLHVYLTVVKISLSGFNQSFPLLLRGLLFQNLSAVLPDADPRNILLHIVSDYYSRPSRRFFRFPWPEGVCSVHSSLTSWFQKAIFGIEYTKFGDISPCLPVPFLLAWVNCHLAYTLTVTFANLPFCPEPRSSPSRHLQDRWQISILTYSKLELLLVTTLIMPSLDLL